MPELPSNYSKQRVMREMVRIPDLAEIGEGEMLVQIREQPDESGIARFFAFWRSADAMRSGLIRGQAFHANLEQFMATPGARLWTP